MSVLTAGAHGERRLGAPAWTLTALAAIVYLIAAPYSSDLAAASYRSYLFEHVGFSLWDNSWYGGHHLLAYSILAPPLSTLIGPRAVAAISMTLVAALFPPLIAGRFPTRATRVASLWLAFGAAISLLSSRVPFDLGLAIGLGSLLAAQRERYRVALALALLCSLSSPVAGAFLALAFLSWALAGQTRAWPAALMVGALLPIALLAFGFPEGGSQPFADSAFFPSLVGVVVIGALIPAEQRALRLGALLYALVLIGSYALATPVGGNAERLGALFGGPLAACVLIGARPHTRRHWQRRALFVLAPFLIYWQANAPVSDFAAASSDAAVHASYYSPLIGELRTLGVGYGAAPARIEAVPSTDHWEARWLAPHVALARGWERQLDNLRNALFYEESVPLTAPRYRAWLARSAVSYIALPDAPLDYSAGAEGRLLRAGTLPYLREVWRSRHWRLFAVSAPTPLAEPPGVLRSLTTDSLTLDAPRAGNYTVRVRFSPYWALAGGSGCVASTGGSEEWTQIQARRAGSFHLVIRFSLARLFGRGARCN